MDHCAMVRATAEPCAAVQGGRSAVFISLKRNQLWTSNPYPLLMLSTGLYANSCSQP